MSPFHNIINNLSQALERVIIGPSRVPFPWWQFGPPLYFGHPTFHNSWSVCHRLVWGIQRVPFLLLSFFPLAHHFISCHSCVHSIATAVFYLWGWNLTWVQDVKCLCSCMMVLVLVCLHLLHQDTRFSNIYTYIHTVYMYMCSLLPGNSSRWWQFSLNFILFQSLSTLGFWMSSLNVNNWQPREGNYIVVVFLSFTWLVCQIER